MTELLSCCSEFYWFGRLQTGSRIAMGYFYTERARERK